jgi:hypothetical protein
MVHEVGVFDVQLIKEILIFFIYGLFQVVQHILMHEASNVNLKSAHVT